MPESPVARLAKAVTWLDEELARLSKEANDRAGALLSAADSLLREIDNDVDIALEAIRRELEKAVEDAVVVTREAYRRRIEEEVSSIREKAEARMEEAVRAVVEEIIAMLGGA